MVSLRASVLLLLISLKVDLMGDKGEAALNPSELVSMFIPSFYHHTHFAVSSSAGT
jgi:hypothetical protein